MGGSTRQKEPKQGQQPPQPIVIPKVDVDIQAKPDVDDQQTSTGDILSTKYRRLNI